MKTFKDVWQLPFHADSYKTYVWDKNQTMVMNPNPDLADSIVDCLNGKISGFLENPKIDNDMRIYSDGIFIGVVRGWGHVQHEFKNIDDAAKCQDEFAEWIIETLKNK